MVDRLRGARGEEAARGLRVVGLDVDLDPVAGGDDERLGDPLRGAQLGERVLERVSGQRDPLAYVDGRALVGEPDEVEVPAAHCAPPLVTRSASKVPACRDSPGTTWSVTIEEMTSTNPTSVSTA